MDYSFCLFTLEGKKYQPGNPWQKASRGKNAICTNPFISLKLNFPVCWGLSLTHTYVLTCAHTYTHTCTLTHHSIMYSFSRPLFQWFLNFGKHLNFLENSLKHSFLGLTPRYFDSIGLRQDLRICNSNKFLLNTLASSVLENVGR